MNSDRISKQIMYVFNDLLKLCTSSIILVLLISLQENQRTVEYLNLNEKDHSVVSKNL